MRGWPKATTRAVLQSFNVAILFLTVVSLAIMHPTRAGHDQMLQLQLVDAGRYAGTVSGLAQGRWLVQLSADDWRLSGMLYLPQAEPFVLLPDHAPDS